MYEDLPRPTPNSPENPQAEQEQDGLATLRKEIEESNLSESGKAALLTGIESGLPEGVAVQWQSNLQTTGSEDFIMFEDTNSAGLKRAAIINVRDGSGLWRLLERPSEAHRPLLFGGGGHQTAQITELDEAGAGRDFTRNEIEEVLRSYGRLSDHESSHLAERQSKGSSEGLFTK
jgi:hypothetical protein